MKLIWASDAHFTQTGPILGLDPVQRLECFIDHVLQCHSDADACLITGDLTENGTDAEYAALRPILDRLPMPVLPIPGNHDCRDLFRQHIALPDDAMTDFVQYPWDCDSHVLLCLDTLVEGEGYGKLCSERMNQIKAWLRQFHDRRLIIAMHHPPVALGLPMLDPNNLHDAEDLMAALSAHGGVDQILCGHVHRMTHVMSHGLAITSLRSLLYQAPPSDPAWDWSTFAPAPEPPGYALVRLERSGVKIHHEQFQVT